MLSTVQQVYRRYSDYLTKDGVAIFLFHGVIEKHRHLIRNYARKHIDVERFNSIIRDLSYGSPISMDSFLAGDIKPYSYVLTFDDGFENNFTIVRPILEDYKLPAAFYITTGFIENGARSWIDEIEASVEANSRNLGNYEIKLLERIRKEVKSDPFINPTQYAADYIQKKGFGGFDSALDSKMTWDQINELNCNPLFTVGGHGHQHQILSFMPPLLMREEISNSIDILRKRLDQPICHYSYPEGQLEHFNKNVIGVLKEYGIVACPTAIEGMNKVGDDPFYLKRIMVT